jgi:hypothetical protein
MAYEQRDNSGTLNKNDKKTSDNHPDYKGDCLINGVKYWMDAWIKEAGSGPRAGQKFLSFSFKPKESGGNSGGQQRNTQPHTSQDQIPF